MILAGLRGAVSLALVESVPIYNGVTGVGSKNKPLLKAMTSTAIIFTIFVLGGGAYYILKWLDITSDDMLIKTTSQSNNRVGGYLYPPLVCGGNDYIPPETELPKAPSWRNDHRTPRFERPTSSPIGSFMPPSPLGLIGRSRSDWSHASHYSAGLNDIGVNDRRMSNDSELDSPPSTRHIV